MTRKIVFRSILALVVGIVMVRVILSRSEASTLTHLVGQTMGTIEYNVKYVGSDLPDYKKEIDSLLKAFNQSLSTYIPDSEISQLNKNGKLSDPSPMFMAVTRASAEIYLTSGGAFDPTVGPLVNAWGFGPDKRVNLLDSVEVDSLMQYVGFSRVKIGDHEVQMDSGMYLDFSAVAKGYAVDLVGLFLESKGIVNYMVEIGGELRAKGTNDQGNAWKIGIEDPLEQMDERKWLAIVELKDKSMATSGNYRNYYTVGTRTIAHTIDPRTGFNTHHTLLSASVFASDCMSADAYATAFMVVGVEGAKAIMKEADLQGFLIYQENGQLKSFVSEELKPYVELNKLP